MQKLRQSLIWSKSCWTPAAAAIKRLRNKWCFRKLTASTEAYGRRWLKTIKVIAAPGGSTRHPAIGNLVSNLFYAGRLLTPPVVTQACWAQSHGFVSRRSMPWSNGYGLNHFLSNMSLYHCTFASCVCFYFCVMCVSLTKDKHIADDRARIPGSRNCMIHKAPSSTIQVRKENLTIVLVFLL